MEGLESNKSLAGSRRCGSGYSRKGLAYMMAQGLADEIPFVVSLSNHALAINRQITSAPAFCERRGSTGSPRTGFLRGSPWT